MKQGFDWETKVSRELSSLDPSHRVLGLFQINHRHTCTSFFLTGEFKAGNLRVIGEELVNPAPQLSRTFAVNYPQDSVFHGFGKSSVYFDFRVGDSRTP